MAATFIRILKLGVVAFVCFSVIHHYGRKISLALAAIHHGIAATPAVAVNTFDSVTHWVLMLWQASKDMETLFRDLEKLASNFINKRFLYVTFIALRLQLLVVWVGAARVVWTFIRSIYTTARDVYRLVRVAFAALRRAATPFGRWLLA